MSEDVTVSKDEWEAFLRDSEELIEKYDVLLRKVNELEESKRKLKQSARTRAEKIRALHSQVSRLLQTEIPKPSPAQPPEEDEVKEEVEVGVVEITPSAEAQVSKESKTIEKILRERREAAMKLLKEEGET